MQHRDPIPEPTEALVRAAKEGDMEAWMKLDQRHRHVLAMFLRGRIPEGARRRFDTEDLLQSAFLSGFRELDSYEHRGPGSFKAWMTRILENRLKSQIRGQHAQKRDARDERYTDRMPGAAARSDSPSELISSAERHARLVEAIADLPDELRDVVHMHNIDKKTLAQTAEELGISKSTVSRRAAQAIEEINRRLDDA